MQSDWDIKSRGHVCARSGREFAEGEIFYTLLFRDGEGFRREDVSEEAWTNRNDNIEPFSYWRSKYEPPAPPPSEALPKDDAEGLLRRLIAEQDPASVNARYILALMLERKKVLRQIGRQKENGATVTVPSGASVRYTVQATGSGAPSSQSGLLLVPTADAVDDFQTVVIAGPDTPPDPALPDESATPPA